MVSSIQVEATLAGIIFIFAGSKGELWISNKEKNC
jgi:hypothetical protein